MNTKHIMLYLITAVFTAGTLALEFFFKSDYYPWFGLLTVTVSIFIILILIFTDFSTPGTNFFYSSKRKNQDVLFSRFVPRKAVMTARKSKLYGQCSACGENTLMPFRCKFCGKDFCPEHRLPENHDCSMVNFTKK